MLENIVVLGDKLAEAARKISLEVRIERILCSPALELDGNAYLEGNKYELDNWKSIKDFINNKLRFNDRGENKVYINLNTNDKIILSGSSAGKLAGHYKYGDIYQKTIVHIPAIIKNMKFLEEMLPNKTHTKYNRYSYYITPVKIDGKPYTILSTVGYNDQGIYYYQNIFDGIVKEVFKKAEVAGGKDITFGRLASILGKRAIGT